MAIRAADIALGNLGLKNLTSVRLVDHQADAHALLISHVIEVQHDRVGLSAIHAWVRRQIFENELLEIGAPFIAALHGVRFTLSPESRVCFVAPCAPCSACFCFRVWHNVMGGVVNGFCHQRRFRPGFLITPSGFTTCQVSARPLVHPAAAFASGRHLLDIFSARLEVQSHPGDSECRNRTDPPFGRGL
jgi:hypothetical protein